MDTTSAGSTACAATIASLWTTAPVVESAERRSRDFSDHVDHATSLNFSQYSPSPIPTSPDIIVLGGSLQSDHVNLCRRACMTDAGPYFSRVPYKSLLVGEESTRVPLTSTTSDSSIPADESRGLYPTIMSTFPGGHDRQFPKRCMSISQHFARVPLSPLCYGKRRAYSVVLWLVFTNTKHSERLPYGRKKFVSFCLFLKNSSRYYVGENCLSRNRGGIRRCSFLSRNRGGSSWEGQVVSQRGGRHVVNGWRA